MNSHSRDHQLNFSSTTNGMKHQRINHARSSCLWTIAGMAIGACIPIFIAAVRIYNGWAYSATLSPDGARCGNHAFLTITIVVIGVPLFTIVGGFIGRTASKIVR